MKREEYESNRDVARRPKKTKFWCFGRDANLVNEWEKCGRCGNRNGTKRNKK